MDAIAALEGYDMKTRIIAAAVLLPLLLVVVFLLPKICTAILFGAMAAIGAYELTVGTGMVKETRLYIYAMISAFWCALWSGLGISYGWLLLGVLIFWAALFAEMMYAQMKLPFEKVAVTMVAGVLLPLLLSSLVRIHATEHGRVFIVIPFVLAFLSDSGAYFAGLKYGKRKLAPTISPKKTVEGVIGGVIGAVVGMVIYSYVIQSAFTFRINYMYATLYGVVGSVAGVFGDLCFSAIKRQVDIKDYGNLIPGHGGILDRFDSMMLIGPLAEILLLILPMAV